MCVSKVTCCASLWDTCHCRGFATRCTELSLWTAEASLQLQAMMCQCFHQLSQLWYRFTLFRRTLLLLTLFLIEVSPLWCWYNSTTSCPDLLWNGSFSCRFSLWFPPLLPLKSNYKIRNEAETFTFLFCWKPPLVGLWDEQHLSLKSALLPDWYEGMIEILPAASGETRRITEQ